MHQTDKHQTSTQMFNASSKNPAIGEANSITYD
jgi:hypothetical protein